MAATATRQAAMPTKEWKAATSCGIEVIGTRRAITAPTAPPTATPPRIRPRVIGSSAFWLQRVARVVSTAMAMPIMPNRLPCWLVIGLESPRSARMNSTPETM
jgi:hypothetical protein